MVDLEFEIGETDEFVSVMTRLVMGHKWWSFENKKESYQRISCFTKIS